MTNVKRDKLRLDKATKDAAEASKGKLIDKRWTGLKSPDTLTFADDTDTSSYVPTDEQMEKINQYTRSTKSANDVYVFPTLSANDLLDRDDDRFDKATIEEFAALPQPYSPVGKSYMVGHDYSKLPVGRIFDVGTKSVDLKPLGGEGKANFLTSEVYVPRTAGNQDFIDNQDFGVYWAVSVGVMLDALLCDMSFCKAPMYNSFFGAFCANGHDKGLWYTEDAAEDDWGWPEPSQPNAKGAEQATGLMKGARDFYELSQVFLGAQFFAALEDKAPDREAAKKLITAAKGAKIPVLGLSRKDAEQLPLTGVDTRVKQAYAAGYTMSKEADGSLRWNDNEGMIWSFAPDTNEVLCLGKNNTKDGESDVAVELGSDPTVEPVDEPHGDPDDPDAPTGLDDGSVDRDPGDGAGDLHRSGAGGSAGRSGRLTSQLEAVRAALSVVRTASGDTPAVTDTLDALDSLVDEAEEALKDEKYDKVQDLLDTADDHISDLGDALGVTVGDDADDKTPKEPEMSKKLVLAAAMKAKLPTAVLSAVKEADGDGLTEALAAMKGVADGHEAEVTRLTPLAAQGEEYLKEVRKDALDWYVRARATDDNGGAVNVDNFEKLLDKCGDDVTIIRSLRDEQQQIAQSKFPTAVRRSSAPAGEPTEKDTSTTSTTKDSKQPTGAGRQRQSFAERIHGE